MTTMSDHVQYKALDGGYGWLVMAGSLCCQALAATAYLCNSMLMVEYTETFQTSKAVVGMAGSVYLCIFGLSSVFVGSLVHNHGSRVVCMVGGVLSTSALVSTSFAPNMYIICIVYGLLGGIGGTCASLSSTIVIQQYFEKKRAFAAGIASMGQSFGSLSVGPVYTWLIYHFGWRGALLIHAGLVLQIVVFGATYRPLLPIHPTPATTSQERISNSHTTTDSENSPGICKRYLDFTLLKQTTFVVYVLSCIVQSYGVITMYGHYPSRAVVNGMTKMEGALLLSTLGLFSTVSRLISSVVANLSCTNRTIQTCVATVVGGTVICLSSLCHDFTTNCIAVGLYGVTVGAIFSVEMTLLTDLVGRQNIAQAQGLFFTLRGLANLTILPFTGWLYDITGNYDVPFYVGGSLQLLSGFGFLLIYMVMKRDRMTVKGESLGDEMAALKW